MTSASLGSEGPRSAPSLLKLGVVLSLLGLAWGVLFAWLFVYRPFNTPAGSMMPTLLVGDSFLVSTLAYGLTPRTHPLLRLLPVQVEGRLWAADPERGDVIVFKAPTDARTNYVKRVVGLPGDAIQVINGVLTINREPVSRERISDELMADSPHATRMVARYVEKLPGGVSHQIVEIEGDQGLLDNTQRFEVPPRHVFVMGDNRDNSVDSRDLGWVGFVPFDRIVGRAEFIYASFDPDTSGLRWDRFFTKIH